ncbi:BCSC C-terminal domain-containing protein [Salinimonas marina]|uniref:BCSC C-terminal domain-containing protein n=1 Tax=Salinimonas marina TaxID=2785918 RepID=A0A7S9HDM5_9ALTE|nr:cellulose synthase subunit BcsC-related outer membrane protein [Salinimonas marina]QPG06082.1 BCSC C-terminal domain-containing protein [Salinimonas marina]
MMRAVICLMVLGISTLPCAGQVVTDYATTDVALPKGQAEQPDTTGVWFHIQQQQRRLAAAEFQRLQQVYPEWQPSPALRTALEQMPLPTASPPTSPAKLQTATMHEGATKSQTRQLFWRLSKWSEAQRKTASEDTLASAARLAAAAGEPEYHVLLGWIYYARNQYQQAFTQFERARTSGSPSVKTTSPGDGIIASVTALTRQALTNDNLPAVKQWQTRYPDLGLDKLIDNSAWQAYEQQNFQAAMSRFELTHNLYGQVLTLTQTRQPAKALAVACAYPQAPRLTQFCTDQLSMQQAALYNAKNYPGSLHKARAIATRRTLTPAEAELQGWAQLATGQYDAAQHVFNGLLRRDPTNRVYAQGLLQSLKSYASHMLFAELYPAVASLVKQQAAGNAWQRKQFWQARELEHPVARQAISAQPLTLFAGLTSHNRSGAAGLGHLDRLDSYIGISDTLADWQWQLQLNYQQLYSGAPATGSWFGDGQVQDSFTSLTGFEDVGLTGSAKYETDNATYYAQLGYTLLDQPVNARPNGQLGGVWLAPDHTLGVTVYHQPVAQSLLSLGSNYFQTRTEAWGAVYKTGLRGLFSRVIMPQWALSLSTVADRYAGTRVIDNNHFGLRVEVSKAIQIDSDIPLDFVRAGPYVSWEGFEHNAGDFTRGQGGYFSPDSLFASGVSAAILTGEGRLWQMKGEVSVGYSWIHESGYRRFALTETGPEVEARQRSGISGQMTLQAQWQLSRQLVLTGFVGRNFAVEYQATQAGLQLRWQPAGAAGLTSDTLILEDPALSGFAF